MKSLGPHWFVLIAGAFTLLLVINCDNNSGWDGSDGGPDTDADSDGSTDCVDDDGDGYGLNCDAGPDCDDSDAFHHNDCPHCMGGPAEGCICDATDPVACYDGPEGTIDVGICRAGYRRCVDGIWSACEGQVSPAAA